MPLPLPPLSSYTKEKREKMGEEKKKKTETAKKEMNKKNYAKNAVKLS